MKDFLKGYLINSTYRLKDDNIIFECDINKENYSQRNNAFNFDPEKVNSFKSPYLKRKLTAHDMCNVTAMVMALEYLGIDFRKLVEKSSFIQPEDALCEFIVNSKEIDEKYKREFASMYRDYQEGLDSSYTPNEIHALLSFGTNLWLNNEYSSHNAFTKFSQNKLLTEVLINNFVKKSSPIVVSMRVPRLNKSPLHHIAAVTGVEYPLSIFEKAIMSGITPKPTKLKLDDPYGNTLNDFIGSGNDIWISWDWAAKNFKNLESDNKKWVHEFTQI